MKNNIISIFLFIQVFLTSCATFSVKDEPIIIPFSLENNRIVIHATVNGVKGRYLWDTGAFDTYTLVSASLINLTLVPWYKNYTTTERRYYIENYLII